MSEEQKNPVGRPTEYDPIYCDKVIKLGMLGKSFEQMSAQLNVSYRTLCRWRDSHEEFCHALEDAQALSQAWWEDQAQSHMLEYKDGERLNPSLWSRSMAARFPGKYSERVKQEISGPGGTAIKTGFTLEFLEANNGNDPTSES